MVLKEALQLARYSVYNLTDISLKTYGCSVLSDNIKHGSICSAKFATFNALWGLSHQL